MTQKIAIVVDSEHSALGTAAISRSKLLNAEVIFALDFQSPKKLLERLLSKNLDLILFTWRQSLIDILNVSVTSNLNLLRRKCTLVVLIPDHLGESEKFQKEELRLLKYVDYYLVTSQKLFNFYSQLSGTPEPAGIFHDIPNVELIRQVREKTLVKCQNQAIWVGNSKWGYRQGFKDHKGFNSVIQPLRSMFSGHSHCTSLVVIDSAIDRKSNMETLQIIQESGVLLQTSMNEGTGLPVLEALGLGTTPISTDVGIAKEILVNFSNLIVAPDPEVIHSTIHKERTHPSLSENEAINIFENFIALISKETFPAHERNMNILVPWKKTSWVNQIVLLLKWRTRYLLIRIGIL